MFIRLVSKFFFVWSLLFTGTTYAQSFKIPSKALFKYSDGITCRGTKPGKIVKGKFVADKKPKSTVTSRCKALSKKETFYVDGTLKKSCAGKRYGIKQRSCKGKDALGFKKLAEALLVAGPGDTIIIRTLPKNGAYSENVRSTVGGIPNFPLTIKAIDKEKVIFDGKRSRKPAIELTSGNNLIQGITFRNYGAEALRLTQGANNTVRMNTFNGDVLGISVQGTDALIEKNTFSLSKDGINIRNEAFHKIRYNIMLGVSGAGTKSGSSRATGPNLIHHNILSGKFQTGIEVSSVLGTLVLHNTALFGQGPGITSSGFTVVKNNITSGTPSGFRDLSLLSTDVNVSGMADAFEPLLSTTTLSATEQYEYARSRMAEALTLTNTSPLLSSGELLSTQLFDLFGTPLGFPPDVGSIQFTGQRLHLTPTPPPHETPVPPPTETPTPPPVETPTPGPTPDPSGLISSPTDPTRYTEILSDTKFLYNGPNAVQKNVAPETIDDKRVAIIKGRVLSTSGDGISGVRVSINNRPEFGVTTSRQLGDFELVVNGGGNLVLQLEKEGFLPVQRSLNVPWRDYVVLDDTVLTPLDSRMTQISLPTLSEIAVHQGSVVTDQDGTRRATLFIPPGETASLVLPNGQVEPLSTVSIRATEFTVGPNGPKAMPGMLPPSSAYTYAAELSVDEAISRNAKEVSFTKPIPFYVENFLHFPVGGIVPIGYYDREKSVWIASDNGRVIKILSVNSGGAALDVSGSNVPATSNELATLHITADELIKLAALYPVGTELWRSEIRHFTPWDCNWPYGPPNDAKDPGQPEPVVEDELIPDCQNISHGSIIECESQTLRESISIPGTPFTLNYSSGRMPGRKTGRVLDIPLSGDSVPSSLKRIQLEIQVAGKVETHSFPPSANQRFKFIWDGKDGFGRDVNGSAKATIRIGYVYQGVYYEPGQWANAFARVGGQPISGDRARLEITLWQEAQIKLIARTRYDSNLGGWTISSHELLDRELGIIEEGGGSRRRLSGEGSVVGLGRTVRVMEFYEHNSSISCPQDYSGQLADRLNSGLTFVLSENYRGELIVSGSCGDLYRIDSDGRLQSFLKERYGNNPSFGAVTRANRIARDTIGDLVIAEYYTDSTGASVGSGFVRVYADGRIEELSHELTGRSGSYIREFAVMPGGNIVFMPWSGVPLVLTPKGELSELLTPNNLQQLAADNIDVGTIEILASPSDGSVYFTRGYYRQPLYQLTAQGNLRKIPLAIETDLPQDRTIVEQITSVVSSSEEIVTAETARVYIGYGSLHYDIDYLKTLSPLGNRSVVLKKSYGINYGSGQAYECYDKYTDTDWQNGIPTGDLCHFPFEGLFKSVTGDLVGFHYRQRPSKSFNTRTLSHAIYRLTLHPDLKQFPSQLSEFGVVSENGSLIDFFNKQGQHLRTTNSVTGKTELKFEYDSANHLKVIRDRDGLVTKINRISDSSTEIVSPFGHRSLLNIGSDGTLNAFSNAAGETYRMDYDSGGLLKTFSDPRSNVSTFDYDELGRLTKDRSADGGEQVLSNSNLISEKKIKVDKLSALGRKTTYASDIDATSGVSRSTNFPDGTTATSTLPRNRIETGTDSDGTVHTRETSPDPRFGSAASYVSSDSTTTPSGLTRSILRQKIAPPNASQIELKETSYVNYRPYQWSYNILTNIETATSASSRVTKIQRDEFGRPLQFSVPTLADINYSYDSLGRASEIVVGSGNLERRNTFSYDRSGNLETVINALNQATVFEYDPVGRVTKQTMPDGRSISFSYDANGNLTKLIPPGRSAHAFAYDAVDQNTRYASPGVVNGGSNETRYSYSLDHELKSILRPGGESVTYNYHPTTGELISEVLPSGTKNYSYNSSTGQLESIDGPYGQSLAYSYDGFLVSRVISSGNILASVEAEYDTDFRIKNLYVNGAGSVVSYTYDADSLITKANDLIISRNASTGLITGTSILTQPTSFTDSYLYNEFGESTSYTAQVGSDSPFLAITYKRDKLGRITEKRENGSTYAYKYDDSGRLVRVDKNSFTISEYTYDANGNRLTGPTTDIGTYDAQDRQLTFGSASFTYTPSGDLLSKTDSTGTTNYAYDIYGNLLSVTLSNGDKIDYIVDPLSRRVGKKLNGSIVQRLVYQNTLRPAAELNADGSIRTRFVYGTKANVPDYFIRNSQTYKIVTDHLGSVRFVINLTTGESVQEINYDEFGKVTRDTNPGFQPFGFAGGLYDSETGLVRFGARDYDAARGRWTSKDPIGFSGGDTNLYGYVLNDPVNWIDPEGKIPPVVVAGAIGYSLYKFLANPTPTDEEWTLIDEIMTGIDSAPSSFPGMKDVAVCMAKKGARKQISKYFPTRKKAKDAAAHSPGGPWQENGKTKGPEKGKDGRQPHFHDGWHDDNSKPNIHYRFPDSQF